MLQKTYEAFTVTIEDKVAHIQQSVEMDAF